MERIVEVAAELTDEPISGKSCWSKLLLFTLFRQVTCLERLLCRFRRSQRYLVVSVNTSRYHEHWEQQTLPEELQLAL